ncbi:MAG: DUF3667 domain-containing protein [Saprospiraceae bacterium]|nr:DUF3667 domain-containing protein [Saprospiraceae bacterium]
MRTPSSKTCLNCTFENESPFQYCPNCGQKNTDGKITFSELWSEFQDAVFNIESRTWRTFKSLFIPGRLTIEYFSGKHRRYVHPLRLFLVTSIVLIIAMTFQDFQSATNNRYDINKRILKNYERQHLYGILKDITANTNAIFPEQQTKIITDTILTSFHDSMLVLLNRNPNPFANRYGDRYGENIDINHYAGSGSESTEWVSKYDFLHKNEDELADIYKKDAGILERLIFKQKVKFIKNESQLFAKLVGQTTWSILLMMPCLALVLYFLYIRHNYFYIEHLIFTFHLQSFSLLVLAVLIVGMNIFPWWIFLTFLAIIWIYLFISMKKVYRQGVGKTILKFLLLSISFLGLFVLILFGTVFISFLLM